MSKSQNLSFYLFRGFQTFLVILIILSAFSSSQLVKAQNGSKNQEANALFQKSNQLLNSNRFDEAVAVLNKAIAMDSEVVQFYHNRGYANSKAKNFDAAYKDYKKAQKLAPDNAEYYYSAGAALLRMEKFEEAIPEYNEAIKRGDKAIYFANRGRCNFKLRNYKGSLADYGKAVKLDPNDHKSWFNLGLTKYVMKDVSGACVDFHKAKSMGNRNVANYLQYCK